MNFYIIFQPIDYLDFFFEGWGVGDYPPRDFGVF